MTQRSFIETGFDSLAAENSVLRERVRKFAEIEPYVEILLANNKKYQQEVSELQIENHKLRCHIDSITEDSFSLNETHKAQVSQLRRGFESDISKLVLELKDILRDKQAMQVANQSLIEELGLRHKRDLQSKKRQLEELETQMSRKLAKLAESLRTKDKQLEQKLWEFREKEAGWAQKVDHLNQERNALIKEKGQYSNQVDILTEEKDALSKKHKELLRENENISTQWLKNEKQKSEAILTLKARNQELQKENQRLSSEVRSQEKLLQEEGRRIAHLTNECEEICKKNHDIETSLRRHLRAYEDLKAEHREVVDKLQMVSSTSEQQIRKQSEQGEQMLEENKRLSREVIEITAQNQSKTSEIEDLLRAIEKLQRKIGDMNKKCQALESENASFHDKNRSLESQCEELRLEKKSLTEKIQLYMSHNSTLEEMLSKEQKKNACLESSRFELQNVARGALSKPEEICREYEREIQKMVKEFTGEKAQIQEWHEREMEDMRGSYERALKEKEEYFNRKIVFLEQEMGTLRALQMN